MGYGAMLFATALTSDSMTTNFADLERGPALMGLAREVMRTALAEGVNPRPFNGFEPTAFMPNAADASALKSLADLADFNAQDGQTHTGIYRDLAVRKRKTEVDQQLGIIVDIAVGHGIDTPLLRRLIELIHDIEEGRREMSPTTFHELTRTDAMTARTALVTGVVGGIGAAIASRLATDGARVIVSDLPGETLASAADRLRLPMIAADLADPLSVKDLKDNVVVHYGNPDIIVNAAGGVCNQIGTSLKR